MLGTLADFRTYHSDRGNAAPTDADDDVATAALVRGSDYIEIHYATRLADGYDASLPQLTTSAYIAAGLELSKPGLFSKTYTESERKVLTKVEGMQWTVTGNAGGIESMIPRSTMIEAMLLPFLNVSQISGGLVV